jgi:hypothetical protein
MDFSLPLLPNDSQLHSPWFQLDYGCNAALVRCTNNTSETLIFVVFGDDFIAGLRVDRRTWVLLPSSAVLSVTFSILGSRSLPPVRQVSQDGRTYLQSLGQVELKIWLVGVDEPLPPSAGSIQGRWLALTRTEPGKTDRLVPFEAVRTIEVADFVDYATLSSDPGNLVVGQSRRS